MWGVSKARRRSKASTTMYISISCACGSCSLSGVGICRVISIGPLCISVSVVLIVMARSVARIPADASDVNVDLVTCLIIPTTQSSKWTRLSLVTLIDRNIKFAPLAAFPSQCPDASISFLNPASECTSRAYGPSSRRNVNLRGFAWACLTRAFNLWR